MPDTYKIVTLKANAQEIVTLKYFWCQICTICYFGGKCSENLYLKMHLAPHMYRIVTVKANAQEIVTFKYIWHHICTKLLLSKQMFRKLSLENAFDTKYVQNHHFTGKCSGNCYLNMHLTPHMYKIITLQANAEEIITLKCFWCQICTKSLLERQMLRKDLTINGVLCKRPFTHEGNYLIVNLKLTISMHVKCSFCLYVLR